MNQRRVVRAAIALVVGALATVGIHGAAQQPGATAPALTGMVHSPSEGAMEGVLVSLTRGGSTKTVTVVSDATGRFSFPRSRLEPGTYAMRIRAIGYELERPLAADVTANATAHVDVPLREARDLASQLSNGEWFMSWPGPEDVKNGLLNCTQCHTLELVARSRHSATEWVQVLERMARYAQGSTPERPQLRPGRSTGNAILKQSLVGREGDPPMQAALIARAAEFLATINLSRSSTWTYPLQRYRRPTGPATHVIITEYALPRKETLPHDAVPDAGGMIWYSDFGSQVLGVLDPKTGTVVEYPVPVTKPGAPLGSLDVVLDREQNLWLGTMYQGALAKFDRQTRTFQTWGSPDFLTRDQARIAMVMPIHQNVDGQVWIGGDDEYQVDVKTGEWKTVDYSIGLPKDSPLLRELSSYGVASDSKNNFYGMNVNGTFIVKVDAVTKKVTPYPTPTPNAGPRRGHMDNEDRLWFAEFRANRIAMFDTRTETFREWAVPTPWANVYDAVSDAAGYAWAGGMNDDRVVRVNTTTGELVEYLLPRATNIRRVAVDNTSGPPVLWIGNNLGASLIRVEPLP